MWFVVSKKEHRRVLDQWGKDEHDAREQVEELAATNRAQRKSIAEKDTILQSTERRTILADLEKALNLVVGYQRALSTIGASDSQISEANLLLERYGLKGVENASYLGFQRRGDIQEPREKAETVVGLEKLTSAPEETGLDRWRREEEIWGEEAYGSGVVRIEAEAVDEGDDKEPGYTRARIRFVDASADDAA